MADDGLLLNFSLGDGAIKTQSVFKGGKWRDRLKAKKIAAGRLTDTAHSKGFNSDHRNETESAHERPSKRQRISTSNGHNSQRENTSQKPHEVISSLFTFNPVSKEEPTTANSDETKQVPSNAPLIDGLDTFTSLGLSTGLTTHLLTKLNLNAPTAAQNATIPQLIREDSDVFIQAETGSGKTLAYLLPIVQRLMEMSKKDKAVPSEPDGQVHRDSGLFAIILAPTRELSKQIAVVLENVLRCANWIVAGTVLGGEKKKSEKARLRKGLNILVATPGRLVDHLSHTEALNVSAVRWLVLDEGDRLMELGFEEDIKTIVKKLEERKKPSTNSMSTLPSRRITILCSATMKMNVQRLGEISLKEAVHIKVDAKTTSGDDTTESKGTEGFSAPAQLKQSYIVVPPKQRLVTLVALLKRTFARKGSVSKAIIFLSCADSVDFHFSILGRTSTSDANESSTNSSTTKPSKSSSTAKPPTTSSSVKPSIPTSTPAPLLTSTQNPDLTLYKLHGSLPQPIRTSTLSSFSKSNNPLILLCTDVASRGLDLPSIDLIIEFDPAFSAEDHIHRIGRTARAGRDGRAIIFLTPGREEGYISVLKSSFKDSENAGNRLVRSTAEEILQKGFSSSSLSSDTRTSGKGDTKQNWENEATSYQLDTERFIIDDKKMTELARKAFISSVRAYATHVLSERCFFDVKELHLGHLAKGFGLRERPGMFGRGGGGGRDGKKDIRRDAGKRGTGRDGGRDSDDDEAEDVRRAKADDAAKKMRSAIRVRNKMGGGADEFNIG